MTNQTPSGKAEEDSPLRKKEDVVSLRGRIAEECRSARERLLRDAAGKMLQPAIEGEVFHDTQPKGKSVAHPACR